MSTTRYRSLSSNGKPFKITNDIYSAKFKSIQNIPFFEYYNPRNKFPIHPITETAPSMTIFNYFRTQPTPDIHYQNSTTNMDVAMRKRLLSRNHFRNSSNNYWNGDTAAVDSSGNASKMSLLPTANRPRQFRRYNSTSNICNKRYNSVDELDRYTNINRSYNQLLNTNNHRSCRSRANSYDGESNISSVFHRPVNSARMVPLLMCCFCRKGITKYDEKLIYNGTICHRNCFRCCKCNSVVSRENFRLKFEKIYCFPCLEETFFVKCKACKQTIFDESYQQIYSKSYHDTCFKCFICSRNMINRDVIMIRGQVVCAKHVKQMM